MQRDGTKINSKLAQIWIFFGCNEENLFVYLLDFFNSGSGQFRALLRFRADCGRHRDLATRSADSDECAHWLGVTNNSWQTKS
jgi:hypothetical protein